MNWLGKSIDLMREECPEFFITGNEYLEIKTDKDWFNVIEYCEMERHFNEYRLLQDERIAQFTIILENAMKTISTERFTEIIFI